MAGKKGMKRSVDVKSLRQNIWRSMQIFKTFTILDLIITVPGLRYDNAQKFVRRLVTYGYLSKKANFSGGRAGEYQVYRLIKDVGPTMPSLALGRYQKKGKDTKKEKGKDKIQVKVSSMDCIRLLMGDWDPSMFDRIYKQSLP
jgi:hypothetical protein